LDWVENKYDGFVRGVNAILKEARWDVGIFKLITGRDVDELWKEYRKQYAEETPQEDDDSCAKTE
jgi:hypothetical protein